MKKINIAIVGCGRIAGHHCRAIKSNENFNLVAVCDLDKSKSDDYSKEFDTILEDEHWNVIKYIRNYFEQHQKVPELRELLKEFKLQYGSNMSTRKYIYKLFPYGYGQQACKISGMRQPKKLWLDM